MVKVVNLGGKTDYYDFARREEYIMQHHVKKHQNIQEENKQFNKVQKKQLAMYLTLIVIKISNQIEVQ